MELLKEAIANDPMWALALCVIAGMLITGIILAVVAPCARSSQISRDEEMAQWDARRKS